MISHHRYTLRVQDSEEDPVSEIGADTLDDLMSVVIGVSADARARALATHGSRRAPASGDEATVLYPLPTEDPKARIEALEDQLKRTQLELTRAREEPEELRAAYQRIIKRLQKQCRRRRSAPIKSRSSKRS